MNASSQSAKVTINIEFNQPISKIESLLKQLSDYTPVVKKSSKSEYLNKKISYPIGLLLRNPSNHAIQAKVVENGFLYNNTLYHSPSGVAAVMRGYKCDGYRSLEVKYNDKWMLLLDYRSMSKKESNYE